MVWLVLYLLKLPSQDGQAYEWLIIPVVSYATVGPGSGTKLVNLALLFKLRRDV